MSRIENLFQEVMQADLSGNKADLKDLSHQEICDLVSLAHLAEELCKAVFDGVADYTPERYHQEMREILNEFGE